MAPSLGLLEHLQETLISDTAHDTLALSRELRRSRGDTNGNLQPGHPDRSSLGEESDLCEAEPKARVYRDPSGELSRESTPPTKVR
ncbi:hypothetical protein NMY22_g7521 [Coprinellus aureogranulatus]|nr:hypothetical protein NMY22_g7521 [Coprinellus aureogranulatus]